MAYEKRPTISVTFGPFTLSYPHLNTPDDKFGEDVYKADGVEDPTNPAMKKCKAELAAAIKTFGLDPKDCNLPLVKETKKDPEDKSKKPKRIETGKLLLKAKTKKTPHLVDVNAKTIDPSKVEIGGGTRALLQGFLAPYNMKGQDGISFTLTGVQVIKLVERSGASFGAYTGDDAEYTVNSDEADDLALGSDVDDSDDADDQGDGGILDI